MAYKEVCVCNFAYLFVFVNLEVFVHRLIALLFCLLAAMPISIARAEDTWRRIVMEGGCELLVSQLKVKALAAVVAKEIMKKYGCSALYEQVFGSNDKSNNGNNTNKQMPYMDNDLLTSHLGAFTTKPDWSRGGMTGLTNPLDPSLKSYSLPQSTYEPSFKMPEASSKPTPQSTWNFGNSGLDRR